jgi:hypothetical protein
MYNTGYPFARFTWDDQSGASTDTLYSADDDGLNVPVFFVLAERGTPGAIYFGGASELTPLLGATTFDPTSPYFNNSTQFLGTAMAGQGVCAIRLVDPAATTATLGLFATLTPASLVQYTKDSLGNRTVDAQGNYIPKLKADNVTQVTEAGYIIKWSVRQLASNESFDTLTPVTVGTGATAAVTYPVLTFKMFSQGVYGNRQGFSLSSTGALNASVAQNINSVLYRFVPMALPAGVSTTASPITDVYGATYSDISLKAAAIDPTTTLNYSLLYTLGTNYTDTDSGNSTLPYDIFVYSNNVKTMGAAVVAASAELTGLVPYMVDLIGGATMSGGLYDHLQIDTTSSTVVNPNVINYALGGSDGDTSWAKLDALVASWMAGSDHGEFNHIVQHPITHFSDPGFSMATKILCLNMLDMRNSIKLDMSTQDAAQPLNTRAQDIAAGQNIVFRAQMHPESTINGVGCCRVGVYAHAGRLISGTPYSGITPLTLNRLIQRRNLDGGSYIKGSSGGQPNSIVTGFYKVNWVADDEASQKIAWADCINTVRHADRKEIYYPALRTVYPNDTSLLADDEVSDRILYLMKIVQRVHARFSGVRENRKTLRPRIERDMNLECAAALSKDDIKVTATLFQTAADTNLGYAESVNLAITGAIPYRTLTVNLIVGRSAS